MQFLARAIVTKNSVLSPMTNLGGTSEELCSEIRSRKPSIENDKIGFGFAVIFCIVEGLS